MFTLWFDKMTADSGNFDILTNFLLDDYLFDNENDFFDDELNKALLEIDTTQLYEQTPRENNESEKRFHKASDDELQVLFDSRQSKSTKKNTTWGIKIFQGIPFSII